MTLSITEQVRIARNSAFLRDVSEEFALFTVTGPDAEEFLGRLTPHDVGAIPSGEGRPNAILDKRSAVIALFDLFRVEEGFLLLSERRLAPVIRAHFENLRFTEDLVLGDTYEGALLVLEGPEAAAALAETLSGAAALPSLGAARVLPHSFTGDEGFLIVAGRGEEESIRGSFRSRRALAEEAFQVGPEAFDILRIEAGVPRHGRDYDETTLVLELPHGDDEICTNNRCYPGQEIVARIRSRGAVKKRMVGLRFDKVVHLENEAPLFLEGEDVGELRSRAPFEGETIALAYVRKPHYSDLGMTFDFEISGTKVQATIVRLPFRVAGAVREAAEREYAAGMEAFHGDDFESAGRHFRRAVRINPADPDLFEALGLAIERSGDVDGAIRANLDFAKAHPAAFMAHTNLSRLYMLKGMKEKAESAMAESTILQMRLAARTAESRRKVEARRKASAARESAAKIEIFDEVLKIDAGDEVANFGIGKHYLDAGDWDGAIRHLTVATGRNSTFSAAFGLLGEALARAGRTEEAIEVLERGIAAAEMKGDLQPLGRMRKWLEKIDHGTTNAAGDPGG